MENTLYIATDILKTLAQAKFYNNFLVRIILKYKPSCTEIVDFGAGIGTFADLLTARGETVICVEQCQNHVQALLHKQYVVYQDIDLLAPESCDYVYSLNVLEHVEDDVGLLKNLYTKLKPGGSFLLYVPAFTCLFSELDRSAGHFRRYHKQELENIIHQAGFISKRSQYVDSLGFFVTLLYKGLSNKKESINSLTIWVYDRIILPFSLLLDFCFNKVLGKNLLIVCYKKK